MQPSQLCLLSGRASTFAFPHRPGDIAIAIALHLHRRSDQQPKCCPPCNPNYSLGNRANQPSSSVTPHTFCLVPQPPYCPSPRYTPTQQKRTPTKTMQQICCNAACIYIQASYNHAGSEPEAEPSLFRRKPHTTSSSWRTNLLRWNVALPDALRLVLPPLCLQQADQLLSRSHDLLVARLQLTGAGHRRSSQQ